MVEYLNAIAALPYGNEALGMASIFFGGSCFMLWYLSRAIKTGKITSGGGKSSNRSTRTIRRDESPASFWSIFSVYSLLLIVLIYFAVLFSFKIGVVDIFDAAETGNVEDVTKYLDNGGDVDAKNKKGWTPLHVAAFAGREEVGKLLIANGASVNASIRGSERTPLHLVIGDYYKRDFVKILIDGGADVNVRDERGWTPLHIAALEGRKENVELLISAGAHINAQSKSRNSTPLDEAIRRKHTKIIDFLREKGAKEGEALEAGKN